MTNTSKRVVVTGANSFSNLKPITLVIRKQDDLPYPLLKAETSYRKFAKKSRWQRD